MKTICKINIRLLPVLFLGLILLLPGCGGSGGGSSAKPGISGHASAHFVVKWPAPAAAAPQSASAPHVIPQATQSILFSVYHAGDIVAEHPKTGSVPLSVVSIDRSHSSATLTVPALVDLIILIEAKPGLDGTGITLAANNMPIRLQNGETKDYSHNPITLGSTVTQVVITPASTQEVPDATHAGPISLVIGQPNSLQLSAQAMDKDSNIVLTKSGTITWALATGSDGSAATIDPVTGAVKPLKPGTVSFAAIYQEVGHSETTVTSANAAYIKVVGSGGIVGKNGISYLLDTTLAFGNWGNPGDLGPSFSQIDSIAAVQDASDHKIVFASSQTSICAMDFTQYNATFTRPTLKLGVTGGGSLFTADDGAVYQVNGNAINVRQYQLHTNPLSTTQPVFIDGISFDAVSATITSPGAITALAVDKQQNVFFASGGSIYAAKSGSYATPVPIVSGLTISVGGTSLAVDGTSIAVTGLAAASDGSVYVVAGALIPNTGTKDTGTTDLFVLNTEYVSTGQVSKYAPVNDVYQADTGFGVNGILQQGVGWDKISVDSRPNQPTSGNIFVTFPTANLIAQFDQFGDFINYLVNPPVDDAYHLGVPMTSGAFHPQGVSVGGDGIVWIAENGRPSHTAGDVYDNRIVPFHP